LFYPDPQTGGTQRAHYKPKGAAKAKRRVIGSHFCPADDRDRHRG